jgi:hypothetical protein
VAETLAEALLAFFSRRFFVNSHGMIVFRSCGMELGQAMADDHPEVAEYLRGKPIPEDEAAGVGMDLEGLREARRQQIAAYTYDPNKPASWDERARCDGQLEEVVDALFAAHPQTAPQPQPQDTPSAQLHDAGVVLGQLIESLAENDDRLVEDYLAREGDVQFHLGKLLTLLPSTVAAPHGEEGETL